MCIQRIDIARQASLGTVEDVCTQENGGGAISSQKMCFMISFKCQCSNRVCLEVKDNCRSGFSNRCNKNLQARAMFQKNIWPNICLYSYIAIALEFTIIQVLKWGKGDNLVTCNL